LIISPDGPSTGFDFYNLQSQSKFITTQKLLRDFSRYSFSRTRDYTKRSTTNMGSVPNTSLIDGLFKRVSIYSHRNALDYILINKLARADLLDTLRQLTLAIEQPEDVVGRVVFFVSASKKDFLLRLIFGT